MPNVALRHMLRSGDLVAVTIAPGRGWVPILRAAAQTGAAVLPIHDRLAGPERLDLLARAQPTVVVDAGGARRVAGVLIDPAIALVIATSGTSGHPGLAELSREAVAAAVRASATVINAGAEDPWISCLPLAHIGGMLVVYRHLLLGSPLTFRRRLSRSVVAALPNARFTSLVPTQLARLLGAGSDLRNFRAILVGGSGLDADLAARASVAGAPAVPTYGMTETCGGVVYAGRPLPGVEVRASGAGELLVHGPTLMRGYRLDPAATAAAFDADGWLRTGDGGDVSTDGVVTVRGKLADVIVSGGEKIWPAEVETALSSHPEVAAVSVAGTADGEWGQRVVARVVPRRRAAPPSLESLREHGSALIARHKLPREVIIVEHLDRTALGKIRRP